MQTLRERVQEIHPTLRKLKVSAITGDVRLMHRSPENAGALFQVASQFNLLEMVSSRVTPEDGVGRYEDDHTQGPACAVAAGAGTIYRNYFAPVDGGIGQTANQQLDGLGDLGTALSTDLETPVEALWTMRNGYALCTESGLDVIAQHLEGGRACRLPWRSVGPPGTGVPTRWKTAPGAPASTAAAIHASVETGRSNRCRRAEGP